MGTNFDKLKINCPYLGAQNYFRDGAMNIDNIIDPSFSPDPAYEPNYAKSTSPHEDPLYEESWFPVAGYAWRGDLYDGDLTADFAMPGEIYNLQNDAVKTEIAQNLAGDLALTRDDVQVAMMRLFYQADSDYFMRVALALGRSTRIEDYMVAKK